MTIIIDAYNLLRTVPPYKKTITEKERAAFIMQLRQYAKIKGHAIVLIFDGGPHEWPVTEKNSGIMIIYSGIHESADDCIQLYIEKNRAKELLLVTSDRELNRYAENYSIPSMDSYLFFHLLQEIKKSGKVEKASEQVFVKIGDEHQSEIDELMMSASAKVPEKVEDIVESKRMPSKQKLTKQERALLKKVNKL